MPSYVVTGASRGLGVSPSYISIIINTSGEVNTLQFQFIKTLAADASNTVIGLARNPSALESKLQEAGITSIHVFQGDVGDAASMKVH